MDISEMPRCCGMGVLRNFGRDGTGRDQDYTVDQVSEFLDRIIRTTAYASIWAPLAAPQHEFYKQAFIDNGFNLLEAGWGNAHARELYMWYKITNTRAGRPAVAPRAFQAAQPAPVVPVPQAAREHTLHIGQSVTVNALPPRRGVITELRWVRNTEQFKWSDSRPANIWCVAAPGYVFGPVPERPAFEEVVARVREPVAAAEPVHVWEFEIGQRVRGVVSGRERTILERRTLGGVNQYRSVANGGWFASHSFEAL